jgi:hypothetical protein
MLPSISSFFSTYIVARFPQPTTTTLCARDLGNIWTNPSVSNPFSPRPDTYIDKERPLPPWPCRCSRYKPSSYFRAMIRAGSTPSVSAHCTTIVHTNLTLQSDYQAPHPPTGSTSHTGANPYTTVKEQKAFEKTLLAKTVKTNGDIILIDQHVVVCTIHPSAALVQC